MDQYAVIRTGGKQYRVSAGDLVKVERLDGEVGAQIGLDEVLLVTGGEGAEAQVGAPKVDGARVTAEIVAHDLARKIIVFKKKRRKGYQKKQGHRQRLTTLKIVGIDYPGAAAAAPGTPAANTEDPAPSTPEADT